MKRALFFAYGVACYLLFLATFAYLVGFVGNLLVPKSIDAPAGNPSGWAVAVDLGLVGLFALQHSIMARPAFKRAWTRLIPKPIERSTYVLFSCAVTGLLMWLWQPFDSVFWGINHPVGRAVAWCAFAAGWLLVPLASLMIDHFDLFGTRQVWLYLRGRQYEPPPFRVRMLYKQVRHPLYLGFAIGLWAAPTMTIGHLLFAVMLTAYMVLAASIEERDLLAFHGRLYVDYQQRVPMFVPRLWPRRATEI